MRRVIFERLVTLLLLLALGSCATLKPGFETPTVTVKAFKLIPANSINPQFEIDLHIINPNDFSLVLKGVSYTASIEGHQLLAGVANDLPVVEAYGEVDVSLQARADLFSGFRLLGDLMKNQRQGLKYQINAKLDVGDFIPAIHIEEKGDLLVMAKEKLRINKSSQQ